MPKNTGLYITILEILVFFQSFTSVYHENLINYYRDIAFNNRPTSQNFWRVRKRQRAECQ